MRGLRNKRADKTVVHRNNGHVGGDGSVARIQGRNQGLACALLPKSQVVEWLRRNHRGIQGISLSDAGSSTAACKNIDITGSSKRSAYDSSVHHATGR